MNQNHRSDSIHNLNQLTAWSRWRGGKLAGDSHVLNLKSSNLPNPRPSLSLSLSLSLQFCKCSISISSPKLTSIPQLSRYANSPSTLTTRSVRLAPCHLHGFRVTKSMAPPLPPPLTRSPNFTSRARIPMHSLPSHSRSYHISLLHS